MRLAFLYPKNPHPFILHSQTVAALPIVNHFLSRLRFSQLLANRLPPADSRSHLDPVATLTALLRCLILRRSPMYSVIEWASPIVPELLGCSPEQLSQLNDDRIDRSLDRLFDADRNVLLTDFVLHMIKECAIPLEQFHNDSTTITLQGQYSAADGKTVRGKLTLKVTFGHNNKDHRPDLKQLLWIPTVTDEAVPVHFKVADGNTQDSRTHLNTWKTLCSLVGNSTFLYVADSKLCSRSTLGSIHRESGRFITVLPRTRKEDAQFKAWLLTRSPDWQEIIRFPHPRLKDGPQDIVRAVDSPFPDPDGYRLIWYHSSFKQDQDAQDRQEQIARAASDLEALKGKVESPRSRLSTREGIAKKVEHILSPRGAGRWMRYEIEEKQLKSYRQEKRWRAGEKTRWRCSTKVRFCLTWEPLTERIEEDSRCDGVFPLLTNCRDLSMREVLEAYRCKQPLIEKRHEMLKSVLEATPVFLKSIARLEALLFLEYVAMTVHALNERELRLAMARENIEQLPIYPEERECKAPTAARVFENFGNLQRHFLVKGRERVQTFLPVLSEVQKKILRLLGLSVERFSRDLS